MKTTVLYFTFFSFFFCFLGAKSQENDRCNHSLIVQFKEAPKAILNGTKEVLITDPKINTFLQKIGVTSIVRIAPIPLSKNPALVYEFEQEIHPDEIIKILLNTGNYSYVESNFIGEAGGKCSKSPNDAKFNEQWGLKNDGTFDAMSIAGADIHMEDAWGITTGNSDIVVAVLDTGLYKEHPELSNRIWNNTKEIPNNGKDDDGNGYIDDIFGWDFVNYDNNPADDFGHGTNITGIIAANGDNGSDFAGVDWNCRIMTLKVLDTNNNGFYSNWISAIYYAVDNGADVINMSLGGVGYSQQMLDAITYAYQNDVVVIACMMNTDNETTYYPAAYDKTIAVGAIDTDYTRASPFTGSSTSGSCYGSHIDLVAPGNKINGLSHTSNTYFPQWSGTSQATPYVTGVVSLLKSMKKNLSFEEARELLQTTSRDALGRPEEDTPEWDKYHGHGLLDAYATLTKAAASFKINIPNCDQDTSKNLQTVIIHAKGISGTEQLQLEVDNVAQETLNLSTSLTSYTLEVPEGTISVAYINDTLERDAYVDYIEVDNQIYQAEDQETNTSVYQNGSCGGSYSEFMHCPGKIIFDTVSNTPDPEPDPIPDPTPDPETDVARSILIRLKGNSNAETADIKVGNSVITSIALTKKVINVTASTKLAGSISVAYTNAANGTGINVYYATIDGVKYLSKYQPDNTGVFQNGSCGGSYSTEMTCEGAITYTTTRRPVSTTEVIGAGSNEQEVVDTSLLKVKIAAYPNPSKGNVTITGLDANHKTSLQVFDIKGTLLQEQKVQTNQQLLNLNAYENGIYLAKVIDQRGSSIHRIIISR